jgi:hypothetical protein
MWHASTGTDLEEMSKNRADGEGETFPTKQQGDAMSEPTKYYKGMDVNFQCRGFQFEIGKTYTHDGNVKACESCFHSYSNPWDVLNYYDVTSRFSVVEIGGKPQRILAILKSHQQKSRSKQN